MRVAVTGPFGNLGSHTLPLLRARGHSVVTLARPTSANRHHAARHGVEVVWGDILQPDAVAAAVAGADVVVHLAAVIPPRSEEHPEQARRVNVDGTAHVIAACRAQPTPPRLLFSSSVEVHGFTLDAPPPRRVTDPLRPADAYSGHKIEAEALVRESTLEYSILRFVDVPILGMRWAHPIMFEIGLDNRIESMHAADAGLALANAVESPDVWGRILFVGGGASCQLTYRDYVRRILTAAGVGALPERAFAAKPFGTDWVDSAESQRLLRYQRHTFDDIASAIAANLGWRRHAARAFAPLVRLVLLRLSPYYRGVAS
jgi:nucleoside-diphosphate-sugar epimerase